MEFLRRLLQRRQTDLSEALITKEKALRLAKIECDKNNLPWLDEHIQIKPTKGFWIVELPLIDLYYKIRVDWRTGDTEIVKKMIMKR